MADFTLDEMRARLNDYEVRHYVIGTQMTDAILGALDSLTDRDRRIEALTKALRELTFAARTSGGTAGRDEALCWACEAAEEALASAAGAEGKPG